MLNRGGDGGFLTLFRIQHSAFSIQHQGLRVRGQAFTRPFGPSSLLTRALPSEPHKYWVFLRSRDQPALSEAEGAKDAPHETYRASHGRYATCAGFHAGGPSLRSG